MVELNSLIKCMIIRINLYINDMHLNTYIDMNIAIQIIIDMHRQCWYPKRHLRHFEGTYLF